MIFEFRLRLQINILLFLFYVFGYFRPIQSFRLEHLEFILLNDHVTLFYTSNFLLLYDYLLFLLIFFSWIFNLFPY